MNGLLMREYHKDPATGPQRFRSLWGDEVTAIQWRTWNQYPVSVFIGDDLSDFDVYGNIMVISDDGSHLVRPRDWVIRRKNGKLTVATPSMFESIYQEIL